VGGCEKKTRDCDSSEVLREERWDFPKTMDGGMMAEMKKSLVGE
jgi:hypothetical protein